MSSQESKTLTCPKCQSIHICGQEEELKCGIYQSVCQHCGFHFKFKVKVTPKSAVTFSVNGSEYSVDQSYPVTTTLNDYLRDQLGLHGTKTMCKEGGCGCCVVSATSYDPVIGSRTTKAINSCLCPLYGCEGLEITTIEGLGGHQSPSGFHPIQEKLAETNGSQCGFCSPGMVMSMNSLLASDKHPSKEDIEAAFDGNICRCTGYRAILDAMKSFSVDKSTASDIEDFQISQCKGLCSGESCQLKSCVSDPLSLSYHGGTWFRPTTKDMLYGLMDQYQDKMVKFVVGNTTEYDVYIDTKGVKELYDHEIKTDSQYLILGANLTFSQLVHIFNKTATTAGFLYLADFENHLLKVANVPVRNCASIAGSLSLKRDTPSFPSDVSVMLQAVNAQVTLGNSSGEKCVPVDKFLKDKSASEGWIILKVSVPSLTDQHQLRSYKVTQRAQNNLAYVNATILMKLNDKCSVMEKPSIVYGGINGTFSHAGKTEDYLTNLCLSDPSVLKGALSNLSIEVKAQTDDVYIQSLVESLFYKYVLYALGDLVPIRLQSGADDIPRPVSSGLQTFSTNKEKWPVTQPLPKTDSKLQTSGEAEYVSDIVSQQGELHAAFVISAQANATIDKIDHTEALAMRGVSKFISLTDIPEGGLNNFAPLVGGYDPEELFCDGSVMYAGQSVGLIIADTRTIAEAAAKKVKITYKNIKKPVIEMEDAIQQKSFFDNPPEFKKGNAEDAIKNSDVVITGSVKLGSQYHYTMETQSCLVVPKEEDLHVWTSTQWIDACQQAVSQVLNINNNRVHVKVKRIGGAYGSKISRNCQIAAACALAAYTMNRPVRIHLDLATNIKMIGRRFPWLASYKAGATTDGILNGIVITYYTDCGCSPNDNAMMAMTLWGDNVYKCPNWHLIPKLVKTNTASNTFCRAPGSVPLSFIIETVMENAASQLKLNPTQFRMQNLYSKGELTLFGHKLNYFNVPKLIQQITSSADLPSRESAVHQFNKCNRWKKRALSLVPNRFEILWAGNYFSAMINVHHSDGSVTVSHGGVEIGQGVNTKVQQVCAYELGISLDLVNVVSSNSLATANCVSTGGSITSELCSQAVIKCCKILIDRLSPVREKMQQPSWPQIIKNAYTQGIDLSSKYWLNPDPDVYYNVYCVAATEVELDILTGESVVRRTDILYDCGESINPEIDVGQIEGAFVMGLGLYRSEEITYDPVTGVNRNASTFDYKPPTSKDIPVDFRVSLLKDAPNPRGVLGSKAVGEPPLSLSCSVLFALRKAIEEARSEIGISGYFRIDGPTTVKKAQQLCLVDPSQYVIQ